jgi:hypothetical protein
MPQYTLTLKWKEPGGGGPIMVQKLRKAAIAVAKKWRVKAWDDTDIQDVKDIDSLGDGARWRVKGADSDICNMISEWEGHKHVDVSGGPVCPPQSP